MSGWNYRVTRRKVNDEYVYEIREMYYSDEGKLSWTEEPITPSGESWTNLGDNLAMMGRAIGQPVFDIDTREWWTIDDLHAERMKR